MDVFAGAQRASERIVRNYTLRGLVFHQTSQHRGASQQHAFGFRVLFPFSRQLHREPRATRRYDFPRPRLGSHAVPFHISQPRNPFHRYSAHGADHVFLFTDGPVRDTPPNRTRNLPHLALRFNHWRGGVRVPEGLRVLAVPVLDPS